MHNLIAFGYYIHYSSYAQYTCSFDYVLQLIAMDAVDWKLLDQLQRDNALSNQALAQRLHLSPATCLRRVRALRERGLIEHDVCVLSADRLAGLQGHGVCALVEVSLDRQDAEALATFEHRVAHEDAVQQCYRVSPGPDFVLVVHALDMPDYLALTQRLFTQDANVRNVKSFFSVKRSKFGARLPLRPLAK